MVSLEQEIVDWSIRRPPWQQYILRHAVHGGSFSGAECDELLESILNGSLTESEPLRLEDFPDTNAGASQVKLVALGNPRHVNALASARPLTFERTGLTLIYGDNGSGKSGYARLLKGAARSRHREEVLSDVFRDPEHVTPHAELEFTVGGVTETLSLPTGADHDLQRMVFYDESCGDGYIATESVFPYRPTALFVMDTLINTCTSLTARLDDRIKANESEKRSLPVVPNGLEDTDSGKLMTGLCHSTTEADVDQVIQALHCAEESVDQLKEVEKKLRSSDHSATIKNLGRQIDKMRQLQEHFLELKSAFEDDKLMELEQLRSKLLGLRKAGDVLSLGFSAEPLEGVGSDVWKILWESARKYSEECAYPGEPFPTSMMNSRCVLCQQELDDESSARLGRFDRFIEDDTLTKLAVVNDEWQLRMDTLRKKVVVPPLIEGIIADLRSDYEELASRVSEFMKRSSMAIAAYLDDLEGEKALHLPGLDFSGERAGLESAVVFAEGLRRDLGSPEDSDRRLAVVERRRAELELLQVIKRNKTEILNEIRRLSEKRALEELRNAAATGPITRKVTELSEESVTEVVRNAFIRETERLRLQKVSLLKTRGDKGKLLHQPKLVGARQRVELPNVFSEGEQTALGLAAFFTDASLDESKSSLILDDPVSSLDHKRRHLVALRLIELSCERQVVVFTHDVSFVADLKREAVGMKIPIAERSISKGLGLGGVPGTCGDTHPWKARDAKQRLGYLDAELSRLCKTLDSMDSDTYELAVSNWAGSLSETWERIINHEIVGAVIAEGGMEVRPMMVKVLVKFSAADQAEFQSSYRRVSQWARRHDKSSKANYVTPEIDDLKKELDIVRTWFERVKGYRK